MTKVLERVSLASSAARLASIRRENAIAAALLDGHSQVHVAAAAAISQPAVSQIVQRRRRATIGAYWTIPFLAGHLHDNPHFTMNEKVRACSQFSSDFRKISDPVEREIALGAPELIGVPHLDSLVAGLADYEAWRVGLPTPEWALSSRYNIFPSWFAAPTDGLKAFVMRRTPPQFSVRGVFIDAADLESV